MLDIRIIGKLFKLLRSGVKWPFPFTYRLILGTELPAMHQNEGSIEEKMLLSAINQKDQTTSPAKILEIAILNLFIISDFEQV
jgi:hypothetical protein